MNRPALIVLAGAALAAVAGSSAFAAASREQCFVAKDMTGWRAVGDRQVNVQVRNTDVYKLDLGTDCPQLRFAGPVIGLQSNGAGSFICENSLADIKVPGQGAATCPVTHISRYTPDQVKALPKAQRP
jgi:hypothetical protein